MFTSILKRAREKIRKKQYVMTLHAQDEMMDDGLAIYDIEHGIVTGEIIERQRDRITGEWKYRVRGETVSQSEIEVVFKLGPSGKLVILTVYGL